MVAEIFHIAIFHIEFLWWVKVNNVEIMNAWRIADFWTSIIRQLQIPTEKKEKKEGKYGGITLVLIMKITIGRVACEPD